MPINLQGVELLKADLRSDAKHYHQLTFGRLQPHSPCGTEQCMAGFCRITDIGKDAYIKEVRDENNDLQEMCIGSGIKQLGINWDGNSMISVPTIFDSYGYWPDDLADAYRSAKSAKARVEVACAALDRLNDDGTIKEL